MYLLCRLVRVGLNGIVGAQFAVISASVIVKPSTTKERSCERETMGSQTDIFVRGCCGNVIICEGISRKRRISSCSTFVLAIQRVWDEIDGNCGEFHSRKHRWRTTDKGKGTIDLIETSAPYLQS